MPMPILTCACAREGIENRASNAVIIKSFFARIPHLLETSRKAYLPHAARIVTPVLIIGISHFLDDAGAIQYMRGALAKEKTPLAELPRLRMLPK
jgi:hypothetical protein